MQYLAFDSRGDILLHSVGRCLVMNNSKSDLRRCWWVREEGSFHGLRDHDGVIGDGGCSEAHVDRDTRLLLADCFHCLPHGGVSQLN